MRDRVYGRIGVSDKTKGGDKRKSNRSTQGHVFEPLSSNTRADRIVVM